MKKEPDQLAIDAAAALAAGMSYGKWRAMQKPVEIVKKPDTETGRKYICEQCGKTFIRQDRKFAKYCSDECRYKAWNRKKRERLENMRKDSDV